MQGCDRSIAKTENRDIFHKIDVLRSLKRYQQVDTKIYELHTLEASPARRSQRGPISIEIEDFNSNP